MNDKFFPELARRLKREGIATLPVEKACLPVLAGGQKAMWVQSWGGVIFNAGAVNDPAANRVYDTVAGISAQVYEYTEAMAAAPPLVAKELHDGFRLLAEFNGTVLAGQELRDDWGYKFVTWQRTPDRTGVALGHYYHNGYQEAKLDFACRGKGTPRKRSSAFVGRGGARERTQFSPQAETELSGLCPNEVQESRQFSNEQLAEVCRCVHETLDSEYPITEQRRKILKQVVEQIEGSVDDLDELVGQSNQKELDAAQEQGRAGPDMEF